VTPTTRDAEVLTRAAGAAGEVVDIHLLLPREHLAGLERAAGAERVTVAHLLRRVIRDYLAREPRPGATG
jgi:hypothetical protein